MSFSIAVVALFSARSWSRLNISEQPDWALARFELITKQKARESGGANFDIEKFEDDNIFSLRPQQSNKSKF
jgi:hypothetical protein